MAQSRSVGFMREAEQHALRVGVVVRGAFARQIGQEQLGRCRRPPRLDQREQARRIGDAAQPRGPVDATCRAQDDRHLMPATGQCVAETVHAARRIGAIAVISEEQHARCAERQERVAGSHDADADGARRIIAAASNHRHAGHPPCLGEFGTELTGDGVPFEQRGHIGSVEAGCRQHCVRPVARRNIEPQRPRAVGHVGSGVAGHPQANIILGQQHHVRGSENLRLMVAHPLKLWRCEAGHRSVARDLAEFGHGGFERGAFGAATPVVPQDRGA